MSEDRGKLPYYRFWASDAEGDAKYRSMTLDERGLYWTMLNLSWINDGLPAESRVLARMVGVSEEKFKKLWGTVGECFYLDGSALRNKKIEEEREYAIRATASRSRGGKSGSRKRWHGSEVAKKEVSDDSVITDTPLRVFDSDSDSDSDSPGLGVSSEEGSGETVLVEMDAVAVLDELKPIYHAAGKPIAPKHEQLCMQLIIGVPIEKRHRIPDYVKWQLLKGHWRDPTKTKSLLNLLRDGDWDVPLVDRTLPTVSTNKYQEKHDQAVANLERSLRYEADSKANYGSG